jgi:small subunit ribosomal protein S20
LASHKSAIKRATQSEARRARNRARKTTVKNAVKSVRLALGNNSPEEAQAALRQAIPAIDKAAAKGTIHRRTASRKISRLSSQVQALVAKQQPTPAS